MSYTNTYYPDYEKMYPGVKITPEVLAALRASDRQMRRFESELKTERFEADNEKQVARFIPSREDSYERLVEEDRLQFADEEMSVEDAVEYREMIRYLYQALAQLEVAEQALIRADFFLMKTEAEFGDLPSQPIGWWAKIRHSRSRKPRCSSICSTTLKCRSGGYRRKKLN